ncbi:hypothetical protein IMG5_128050, partial [Ichthyophthirius multifiliis]
LFLQRNFSYIQFQIYSINPKTLPIPMFYLLHKQNPHNVNILILFLSYTINTHHLNYLEWLNQYPKSSKDLQKHLYYQTHSNYHNAQPFKVQKSQLILLIPDFPFHFNYRILQKPPHFFPHYPLYLPHTPNHEKKQQTKPNQCSKPQSYHTIPTQKPNVLDYDKTFSPYYTFPSKNQTTNPLCLPKHLLFYTKSTIFLPKSYIKVIQYHFFSLRFPQNPQN